MPCHVTFSVVDMEANRMLVFLLCALAVNEEDALCVIDGGLLDVDVAYFR